MTLKEFMARRVSLATLAIGLSLSSPAADVTIEKPYFRWLFGGFGFQNPEANFLSLMSEGFRDQRVLKTFAEIAPSFARVYKDGKQIASTVATSLAVSAAKQEDLRSFSVKSVDKWGNEGK